MKTNRVLITGGTGSWGTELTRQILASDLADEVIIYSRGEHRQVEMKRQFTEQLHRLKYIIGDVRDLDRLMVAMKDVQKVFHLAALKHVPICEENPWETVLTNIQGTNNVIQAAIVNDVEKMIFVSTDKAVDPLNLYGVTKACSEKLIINANRLSEKTDFLCIRAGNVLGSNGSVVPLFIEQIKKTNVLTITHPDMTRFFLRVQDAIGLLLKVEKSAVGGEIVVIRMPSCKITDLAQVIIEEYGDSDTQEKYIGIRPGEKIHEVLISRYEASRVIEKDDMFVILPMVNIPKIKTHYQRAEKHGIDSEYSSENAEKLTKQGIRELLKLGGFFESGYKSNLSELSADDLLNYFKKEGWIENR